jgi:hypothetical protein
MQLLERLQGQSSHNTTGFGRSTTHPPVHVAQVSEPAEEEEEGGKSPSPKSFASRAVSVVAGK